MPQGIGIVAIKRQFSCQNFLFLGMRQSFVSLRRGNTCKIAGEYVRAIAKSVL
jgi:hypothetical protein